MEGSGRRALLVSKGWVQAVLLVVLFGFFGLGFLAFRTYQAKPPIPERVVDPSGAVVYTESDVSSAGQKVFLGNGLMEYGSVFGHGAYLGPDYTADYLRRASNFVRRELRRRSVRPTRRSGRSRTSARNRYDERTGTLTLTARAGRRAPPAGAATTAASSPSPPPSTASGRTRSPTRTKLAQLTAFFAWTAWAGAAERPGHNYSYTNNWPPEPRVDNKPTANVIVWSVLSLIALLGGIGILFAAFGRWGCPRLARPRAGHALTSARPGDVALTPAQRACAWFFFVMAALFLIQTFVGAASQHYRAEIDSFFGFDLARVLPVQPDAHLARAARDLLGGDVVRGRRHLPGADDRPPRAQGPGQARVRAARRARRRRVRHADRLLPGHPRRTSRTRPRTGSACRASSTSTSPASGRCCSPSGCSSGCSCSGGCCARAAAQRARRQHAVAVLHGRAGDPGLLRRRPAGPRPATTSPSPSSGASGSCTSGSRTSSSCSPP